MPRAKSVLAGAMAGDHNTKATLATSSARGPKAIILSAKTRRSTFIRLSMPSLPPLCVTVRLGEVVLVRVIA